MKPARYDANASTSQTSTAAGVTWGHDILIGGNDCGDGLLCYCRAGFEPELAAELTDRAGALGLGGYARTQRDSGYVIFAGVDGRVLSRLLPWRELIFARQKLMILADLRDLDPRDRIAPILVALRDMSAVNPVFGSLVVEHPDSDEAKPLAGLARSFANALRPALRKAGVLASRDDTAGMRLHVCFVTGEHALLAMADPGDSAPWPQGILRLRMLTDAPSRSALKLEEALLVLLDGADRNSLLQPDMRAADLGAAPGGWTWVLTRQGMRVVAIDNGPLRPNVLQSGQVEHLRADGFTWQPPRPLDWMVCDMVEQPRRVAERMATWLREGWCRQTIFNLKLPMKKRWQETQLCLQLLADQSQHPVIIHARQLYHDREEITVFARRDDRQSRPDRLADA